MMEIFTKRSDDKEIDETFLERLRKKIKIIDVKSKIASLKESLR